MPLSVLAALGVAFFSLPLVTHELYRDVEKRILAQIAVDNAAIVVGREGRELLEDWRKMEHALEKAEAAHHLLHLCARTPGPQAANCVAEDRLWEAFWETRLSALELRTRVRWPALAAAGREEGRKLGVELQLSDFSAVPPVGRETCPVCGRRLKVRWTPPPVPRWRDGHHWEESVVRWRRDENWEYRIAVGEKP